MKRVDLSSEQERAADELVKWARVPSGGARGKAGARGPRASRVRALRGLAGTGKTTAAAEVARRLASLGTRVAVVAPTGKAAHVLRTKGVHATTIHSAVYDLVADGPAGPEFVLRRDFAGDPDVVLCDEASMATEEHLSDLLARVPKVLLVGDPGQLPPVSGRAVLASAEGFDLGEIHRQALDSGVVRFALAIRNGSSLEVALRRGAPDVIAERPPGLPGVLLVSRNDQRVRLNASIRAQVHRASGPGGAGGARGTTGAPWLPPWPCAGDRVVCLTNHRRAQRVDCDPWCNGTVGEVVTGTNVIGASRDTDSVHQFTALCDDNQTRAGSAWLRQLDASTLLVVEDHDRLRREARFAWGWALTCHKAQGSEWDEVAVMGDGFGSAEDLRAWRYTAATRAAKKLWWAT